MGGFFGDLVGDDKSDGLEGGGPPPVRTRSTPLRACFESLSMSGPTAGEGRHETCPYGGGGERCVCDSGGWG